MADKRFYIDTSAYLCILLGEKGHEGLAKEIAGGQLLSSVLLILEASRNLIRLSREGWIQPTTLQGCLEKLDSDIERFLLRDLTLDLCSGLVMPVVSTPRSMDLAHLRTALWFHRAQPLARFVSLDAPQKAAAREMGLPVK